MTDDEIFNAFEAGTFDAKTFSHKMHIHVGWIYVTRLERLEAIERFADRLRAWAIALKIPGKYHATITWFFMLLISERQTLQSAKTFDAFIDQNSDLLSKSPSILEQYYTAETLASPHARTHYLLPDNLNIA